MLPEVLGAGCGAGGLQLRPRRLLGEPVASALGWVGVRWGLSGAERGHKVGGTGWSSINLLYVVQEPLSGQV